MLIFVKLGSYVATDKKAQFETESKGAISWTYMYTVDVFEIAYTPQPLYNTIVGVQDNFRVSYPICVIRRVKYIDI